MPITRGTSPTRTTLPYSEIERAKQVPKGSALGQWRLNLSDTGVWVVTVKLPPLHRAARVESL